LGVRGGVDLEHVDVAALGDLPAGVTFAARIRGRPVRTAQRAREDAGRGRLAHPTRTGKDERLRDAFRGNRVAQRARDRRLADNVIELLGAPFARENLVSHSSGRASYVGRVRTTRRLGLPSGPEGLRHSAVST